MQTSNNASFTERNAALIKGFIIGFLIIVLLIPTFMINGIISERQGRKDAAIIEVSSKWGNRQTFVGPVLKVPYYEILKTENINAAGKKEIIQEKNLRFAYFLPEKLKINGVASPESRFRGIYEIVVYSSKIACSGNFSKVSLEQFGATKENIDWKNAIIMLNISDLRGIEEEVVLDWNGKKTSFNPGAKLNEEFTSGIQTPVIIEDEGIGEYNFSLNLSLKGSASLNFVPVGKTTEVAIKSNWKNPSFDGAFLPDKRIVNEKGFVAEWKVLHLNRNFPQQWNTDISLNSATFGVDLITPNDSYQKSDRSVKYAILIIALTFMAFFFIEILNQKTVHPFHYIIDFDF
jgi:inner membrane protein